MNKFGQLTSRITNILHTHAPPFIPSAPKLIILLCILHSYVYISAIT